MNRQLLVTHAAVPSLVAGAVAFCLLLSACAGTRLPLPSILAQVAEPASNPPAAATAPASTQSVALGPDLAALKELTEFWEAYGSVSSTHASAMTAAGDNADWSGWADATFEYDGWVEGGLKWLDAHPPSQCYKPLWDAMRHQVDTLHDLLIYQAGLVAYAKGTGVRHPIAAAQEDLDAWIDDVTTEMQKTAVTIETVSGSSQCQ